ncbi:hypothetical protein Zmor_027073 [Zophobas morio]|uniref:Uncharacterized protein n=1 Tax=Zophobas morio TaxID=2755281 RepID=A0AA38M036_9CUCU|nr:hypothetical protein Zmor_027073 [Zophobas morio]
MKHANDASPARTGFLNPRERDKKYPNRNEKYNDIAPIVAIWICPNADAPTVEAMFQLLPAHLPVPASIASTSSHECPALAKSPNNETFPEPAPPKIMASISIPIPPAMIKGIIVPKASRIADK